MSDAEKVYHLTAQDGSYDVAINHDVATDPVTEREWALDYDSRLTPENCRAATDVLAALRNGTVGDAAGTGP